MKFTYKTTEKKYQEWLKTLKENWGTLYTDWTFNVKWVEWRISNDNNTVTINITDKPWLASWNMIEDKLDAFFK